MEKYVIKSLSYFCKINKLSPQNMWKVSKRLRKHHKNYKCEEVK